MSFSQLLFQSCWSFFCFQKSIRDKLKKLKNEKENIKEEIRRIEPDLANVCKSNCIVFALGETHANFHVLCVLLQLNANINKRDGEIKKLETRINEIVDLIYKDFSKAVGVDIREYEETQLTADAKTFEKKVALRNQISKLKYQYVSFLLFK